MIHPAHQIFRRFGRWVQSFKQSPNGRKILKYLGWLAQGLIVGIIALQLTGIGWEKIFSALPTTPYFYLLFLFIYFLLPISETLAYKISWGIPFRKSLSIFIKKRIFNKDILGYSGEVVLMQWASKHTDSTPKQIFKDVRDMNIISSAASTLVALGLLAILFMTGNIRASDQILHLDYFAAAGWFEFTAGIVVLIILAVLILRYKKYLFSMPVVKSAKVFSIHSTRMVLLYAAQILQWHIVLPDISLETWFTFLSVNIIVSRIPFIPSQDLVATGTNIEVAKLLQVPVAPVTGIFLVHDMLGKLLNFSLYLFLTLTGKGRPEGIFKIDGN